MVTYEAFIGALGTFLILGAGAFYWVMSEIRSIRREMQAIRQEHKEDNQTLRQELREEIRVSTQRILEALYFHRHDAEGAAVFYPPTPPTTQAE